jgi:hypothetical protein
MRKSTSDILEITSWLRRKYRHVYVTTVMAPKVSKRRPCCDATRASTHPVAICGGQTIGKIV